MIAWITFGLMIAVACVGLALPLLRRASAEPAAAPEAEALRRRLADLESELAASEGAEDLKAETIRRFLAETPAAAPQARAVVGRRYGLVLAACLALVVAIGAGLLYAGMGRPDMTAAPPPAAPAAAAVPGPSEAQLAALTSQLEVKLRQTPSDPEGWKMLGWSYTAAGRYADAANAYGRAAALAPAHAEYASAEGEALVGAAKGDVTHAARAAFAAALRADPADPRARYFMAAAKDEDGDHGGALTDWIALLKSAPPDAGWAGDVRAVILKVAAERGVDVSARMPPAGPVGDTGGQVSPAQRPMIQGMVDKLAARLRAQPKDADGWIELMRSRMVLGEPDDAADAYRAALKAFADAPDSRASLTSAAHGLGVPGA